MNTALNFVNLPSDHAIAAAPNDTALETSRGNNAITAGERQDFADGAEKNSSFAKVLQNESKDSSADTRNDSAKAASSENGNNEARGLNGENGDHRENSEDTGAVEGKTSRDTSPTETTANSKEQPSSEPEQREESSETLDQEVNLAADGQQDDSELTAQTAQSDSHTLARRSHQTHPTAQQETADKISEVQTSSVDARANSSEDGVATGVDTQSTQRASGQSTSQLATTSTSASASATANSEATHGSAKGGIATAQQTNAGTGEAVVDPGASHTRELKADLPGSNLVAANARSAAQEQQQQQSQSATKANSSEAAEQVDSSSIRQRTANAAEVTRNTAQSATRNAEFSVNPDLHEAQKEARRNPQSNPLTASLESFPAAGKPLPPTGKSLPAGLFFQGDQEAATLSRSDIGGRATPGFEFDASFNDKSMSAGQQFMDKALDIGIGNRLLNNQLNSITGSAESVAASASSNTAGESLSQPALNNPLLQVSSVATDRSLLSARPAGEPLLNLSIAAQAGSAEWQNQLSGRIRWMGNVNISSAELKLHPAELGAVEIQISTEDDQTRVSFITSNAAAKEVIESTLPRLRELLGEGGLQLEQGDVAQRDLSDDRQAQEMTRRESGDQDEGAENDLAQANLHYTRKSTNQIDHYV